MIGKGKGDTRKNPSAGEGPLPRSSNLQAARHPPARGGMKDAGRTAWKIIEDIVSEKPRKAIDALQARMRRIYGNNRL
ncbi:MAG: hypothetical protein FJY85_24270 [Deltaproteobacteria bacterium]|nr:hypothetical protein [Deltaproteobacteria bacterium]